MTPDDIRGLLSKESMEKDVLNRIRWDSGLRQEDFDVSYYDRVAGKLIKIKLSDSKIEGDFLKIGDSTIPLHRIREVLYRGEVVWAKRRI